MFMLPAVMTTTTATAFCIAVIFFISIAVLTLFILVVSIIIRLFYSILVLALLVPFAFFSISASLVTLFVKRLSRAPYFLLLMLAPFAGALRTICTLNSEGLSNYS